MAGLPRRVEMRVILVEDEPALAGRSACHSGRSGAGRPTSSSSSSTSSSRPASRSCVANPRRKVQDWTCSEAWSERAISRGSPSGGGMARFALAHAAAQDQGAGVQVDEVEVGLHEVFFRSRFEF